MKLFEPVSPYPWGNGFDWTVTYRTQRYRTLRVPLGGSMQNWKKMYLRQHITVFLSCEFAPVPLLCKVWGFCCNSCKILKDGPAGKCSLHSNLELFAAECFLFVRVYLGSCIITCMSNSQVLLDVTWGGDIHRYAYMYGIDFFLRTFSDKSQRKHHRTPLSL